MEKENKMNVSITIDRVLWDKFKKHCKDNDMTMSARLGTLITLELNAPTIPKSMRGDLFDNGF